MDFIPPHCYIVYMNDSANENNKRFVEHVGVRLRRLRQEKGMSLQEVCDSSGGSFVVSTLSAYERGKRSLSLERLLEIAAIYDVSPLYIMDITEKSAPESELDDRRPLRINLRHMERLGENERRPLENYLDFLRNLRNDTGATVMTIRKNDLEYLSTLYGIRPQTLKDRLQTEGVIEL